MIKFFILCCAFNFCVFRCLGTSTSAPLPKIIESEDRSTTESTLSINELTIQQLYELLNKTLLENTISELYEKYNTTNNVLNQKVSDKTPTTKSPLEYRPLRPTYAGSPGGISSGNIGQIIPPGEPWPANPPVKNNTDDNESEDSTITTTQNSSNEKITTKSPLEYRPQRPTYAGSPGGISSGIIGQIIPPGKPWPANPPMQSSTDDTDSEDSTITTTQNVSNEKLTTKSPLEYRPQRPTYAGSPGGISSGIIGQIIPPGKPWPANPPMQSSTDDTDSEDSTITTTQNVSNEKLTTKSPLEYRPQRPTYAGSPGGISSGNIGQIIPPGEPWPANPPVKNNTDDNESEDSTITTTQNSSNEKITTKSPLEYRPQRPTYAGSPGGISSGIIGQIIPPGKPWPANPPMQSSTDDTVSEDSTITTTQNSSNEKITTKSPLEYRPQRPTYAGSPGGISSGIIGQIIPPGEPWPANPPVKNNTDDNESENSTITTTQNSSNEKITTKSPLEYRPQRPTYAGSPGGISSGNIGQIIPPGKPWPANPPMQNNTDDNGSEDSTITTTQNSSNEKVTTKSPLEYRPQRPTYAGSPGGISSGIIGQIIPPGKPWPAFPPRQNNTDDNESEDSTITTTQNSSNERLTTKSPLEYRPQRPTYAGSPGGISSGIMGQIIPPGKPWPASPPVKNNTDDNVSEDSTITTTQNSSNEILTTKSPLEYRPQRPTYAGSPGGISSGIIGQIIPPGKPWPANPPMQHNTDDNESEDSTITSTQNSSNERLTTKSPLEYRPQRPTYAGLPGGISSGFIGQIIPPGKPWPANPPMQHNTDDNESEDSTITTTQNSANERLTTKSPLEYRPQRPTYAGLPGGISSGFIGQIIPPGKPWPANPPMQQNTDDNESEDSTITTTQNSPNERLTTKSPLEYRPQRPTYAGLPGGISSGFIGQIIPPGKPWPANPPMQQNTDDNESQDSTITTTQNSSNERLTTKSPLEYRPQRPTYAGLPGGISSGNIGQIIPPGKPWPANPPMQQNTDDNESQDSTITTTQNSSNERLTTKSPLEYRPQRPTYVGLPGGISSGNIGQIIPPGKPWSANPPMQNNTDDDVSENDNNITTHTDAPKQNITTDDVSEVTTVITTHESSDEEITTKSSLVHHLQRHLIPPSEFWSANQYKERKTTKHFHQDILLN